MNTNAKLNLLVLLQKGKMKIMEELEERIHLFNWRQNRHSKYKK